LKSFESIRYRIVALALCLLTGGGAFAQIQADGLHLGQVSASLAAGYDGQIESGQGSNHDLGLGGSVSTGGYYYNPNFISFQTNGYYNRAQSNAGSTNLETSKGYNIGSHIFGGSMDPGSINFGQSWGASSNFGLPELSGLNSNSDSRSFGVSWLFKNLPVLKNVSVAYADSTSNLVIPGISLTSNVSTRSYAIGTSGYNFWGFPLSGSYEHINVNSSSNLFNGGGSVVAGTNVLDSFKVMTGHNLPSRGKFTLAAYRTTSTASSAGESTHTVSDELDSSISSHVWRFPLSGSVSYNDNVYGSVLQELNTSGQTILATDNSPRIGTLLMNISTSYTLPHHVFLTGFASHQEEFVGNQSVGATSAGANASYNFSKLLNGLSIIVGVHDSASQEGNTGAAMIGTVTYTRNINGWRAYASFNYNQNVQTLLALYTSSSMSSAAALRRQVRHGLIFGVNGGYSRSVFNNNSGTSTYSENAGGNISWKKQSVTATWAQSGGTALLTSSGLVPVTTPGLITNAQVPFSGRSYSLGYASGVVKNLGLSLGWTKFQSDNSIGSVLSNISSQTYTGSLSYSYRKLNFLANATRSDQGVNSSSTLPSQVTVYYFGVTRWFNFF